MTCLIAASALAVAFAPLQAIACGQSVVGIQAYSTPGFSPVVGRDAVVHLDAYNGMVATVQSDGRVRVFGELHYVLADPGWMSMCEGVSRMRGVAEVGVGYRHVVARLNSGSVQCAGSNAGGQCDVPADLGAAVSIGAYSGISWAVRADGAVRLWGVEPSGLTAGPDGLPPIRSLTCGVLGSGFSLSQFAVAVQMDGHVSAWGDGFPVVQTPPLSSITGASKAAAGNDHLVVLLESGEVVAWNFGGQDTEGAITFPMPAQGVVDIDADVLGAVFKTADGMVVPSQALLGYGSQVWLPEPIAPALTSVRTGNGFYVGLLGNGQPAGDLHSLGPPGVRAYPQGVTSPVYGVHTGRGTIVLNGDGTLATWTDCLAGEAGCGFPEFTQPVVDIAASGLPFDPPGLSHELFKLANGSVVCSGNNSSGESTVPADLGAVAQVYAADGLSGAVLADGSVRMWGRDDLGQLDVPTLGAPAIKLSGDGGGTVVAAVLADGTAACWGNNGLFPCGQLSSIAGVRQVHFARYNETSAVSRIFVLLKDGGILLLRNGQEPEFIMLEGVAELGDWLGDGAWGDAHARRGDGTLYNLDAREEVATAWRFERLCGAGMMAILRDEDCTDLDGDGFVGGAELAAVLGAWGTDGTGAGGGSSGQGVDFDGSGLVDGADLLIVLSQYGECGP